MPSAAAICSSVRPLAARSSIYGGQALQRSFVCSVASAFGCSIASSAITREGDGGFELFAQHNDRAACLYRVSEREARARD